MPASFCSGIQEDDDEDDDEEEDTDDDDEGMMILGPDDENNITIVELNDDGTEKADSDVRWLSSSKLTFVDTRFSIATRNGIPDSLPYASLLLCHSSGCPF